MSRTLLDILIDANSVLDLEATQPTGTELTTRANYAHQAVMDAAARNQLSEFKKEFLTTTSTLATIPLPSDFRELQEFPRVLTSGGTWEEFEAIEVEDKYSKSNNEKYCYVLGNPAEGYNLIFNGLQAGQELSVIYQRYPSGLLTLSAICELSDPQVVVRKIESYVLYSRSDDRFPIADQRAEQTLANMIGRELKGTTGHGRNTKMSFRNPLG